MLHGHNLGAWALGFTLYRFTDFCLLAAFENTPTKPLKDQYQTLERQLKSGIPMPLADSPIVSRYDRKPYASRLSGRSL